jgi:hypothetical protein
MELYTDSENAEQILEMANRRSGAGPPDATDVLISALLHARAGPFDVGGVLLDMLAAKQSGSGSSEDLPRQDCDGCCGR